jgi:plastocyanin
MKLLNSLVVLLALLQISFAELCNAPTKTVTITVTDATQGVAFPTQNVNKGDTITWVNQRSSTIVVISTDTPRQFESPALGTGQSFSFKFDVPGSFNYWLLFELNSISLINVVNCDAFTTTASPSPTQVFSRTASPSVTAAQTPSPTPSFTPSRSGGRLPPSATPSPIDFCTGVPTNEVHLTPGAGVPIMENKTVAINAILSTAFMPLETEDVRITVTATVQLIFQFLQCSRSHFPTPFAVGAPQIACIPHKRSL